MSSYNITDKCIGCTLCAKQCPVNAISGNLKEKHIIDKNKCIGCGLCGRVCPQAAVITPQGETAVKQPKNQWQIPYIKQNCAGCKACVENCPVNCLEISGPAYHGDISTKAVLVSEDRCIGCGICEKSCPVDAIEMTQKGETVTEENTGGNSMYTTFCRVFQFVMKIGNYVLPYRMPEYIEGTDSVLRLPLWIKQKGLSNVMVVTDNGLMKLGLPDPMLKAMDEAGVKYTVFSNIEPNPTSDNVEEGYALYKANHCNGLVAFGGGAPMDCAKAIGARVARPNKKVAQLQGLLKVIKPIPTFFAVPTTSGTGSETTVAAVITDSATHHKASINDTALIPKYAVLDPQLTVGLPPFVTATTGMDALCHAVEAYTNYTYTTKLERKLALDAIRLIHDNLLTAYNDGKNLEARQNMQKAAFYAGRAFTRGCVGYVHAVGHTLGGLYGVPHGLAMSVILPHVMRQFGPAVYDKLADCADVCGISGADNKEKALGFISWIEDLKKQMNLPAGIDNIERKDYNQIIKWASAEANPLYPVPVIWGKADFEKLLDTLKTAK